MLKRLLAPLALVAAVLAPGFAAATTLHVDYFVTGTTGIQPSNALGNATVAVTGSASSPISAPSTVIPGGMVGVFTAVDGPVYVALLSSGTPDPTGTYKFLVCPGTPRIVGVGAGWQISAITATDVANCGAASVASGTVTLGPGSAIAAKVGIDQTTPGTTNGVQVNAALPAGTNSIGTVTTNPGPTSSSALAIAATAQSAAGSSLVLKATPGNLYGYKVTAPGTAGYVMVFDATSAPADGAVTPKHCDYVPANGVSIYGSDGTPPESYATGIVIVWSSTGCFTKTAANAGFMRGRVQ